MKIPEKTSIKAEQYARLTKLNDTMNSVNQMMQMFQANCQAKLQQYQADARSVWLEIAKDNPDLDFERVAWEPGQEASTIVPMSMRLG